MYYNNIELLIEDNWISINRILSLNEDIKNINLEKINIYKNLPIYRIFQICKFYNIDYNEELKIRQKINIYTKNNKDFNGKRKCKCIICNREFKAIRNNIKICASKHYCKIICLYSGEIYEKEIMKWNKIEHYDNSTYLYGKCFKDRSSQVSTNNIVTILKGTNNICNLTYDDRSAISARQKKNGTFAFWNYTYEERSKRSKALARKRIKEGSHNWLWNNKTEEAKISSIENSVKTKKENGTYRKMMLERWQDPEFRNKMYRLMISRLDNTINFLNENCKNIKFNKYTVNYNSFILYDNIPGVWTLWSDNICLTCGQTSNLNRELQWCLRVLANKNLKQMEIDSPGITGRWNEIQEYSNLEFKLISVNEKDKDKREIIEAIEAINNNALYWLPSITQQSNIFKEKVIEYINN